MQLLIEQSTLKPWSQVFISWQSLRRWKAAKILWKPQTLWWECNCAGIICLKCCLRKGYILRMTESARYISWKNFAIIVQCSPCILLGCVLILAKVSLSSVGTSSAGIEPRYRYLSSGIRMIICWRETLSFLDILFDNTKLVNCNQSDSFPQHNEFSNVS